MQENWLNLILIDAPCFEFGLSDGFNDNIRAKLFSNLGKQVFVPLLGVNAEDQFFDFHRHKGLIALEDPMLAFVGPEVGVSECSTGAS